MSSAFVIRRPDGKMWGQLGWTLHIPSSWKYASEVEGQYALDAMPLAQRPEGSEVALIDWQDDPTAPGGTVPNGSSGGDPFGIYNRAAAPAAAQPITFAVPVSAEASEVEPEAAEEPTAFTEEAAQKRGRRSQKAEQAARDAALAAFAATPGGAAWLREVMGQAHVFGNCFHADARLTDFALGERNIGARILGDLFRAAPQSAAAIILPEMKHG